MYAKIQELKELGMSQNAVAAHIRKYERARLIPLAAVKNSLLYKAAIELSTTAAKTIQKITAYSYKLYEDYFNNLRYILYTIPSILIMCVKYVERF